MEIHLFILRGGGQSISGDGRPSLAQTLVSTALLREKGLRERVFMTTPKKRHLELRSWGDRY